MERISLCGNIKCNRKLVCMRYNLIGDSKDIWVEFNPIYYKGKLKCQKFIHKNSEQASEYRKTIYGESIGGNYEISFH